MLENCEPVFNLEKIETPRAAAQEMQAGGSAAANNEQSEARASPVGAHDAGDNAGQTVDDEVETVVPELLAASCSDRVIPVEVTSMMRKVREAREILSQEAPTAKRESLDIFAGMEPLPLKHDENGKP